MMLHVFGCSVHTCESCLSLFTCYHEERDTYSVTLSFTIHTEGLQ